MANSGGGVNVFALVMTTLRDHYNAYNPVRLPKNQHGTPFQLCYMNNPNFRDFPIAHLPLQWSRLCSCRQVCECLLWKRVLLCGYIERSIEICSGSLSYAEHANHSYCQYQCNSVLPRRTCSPSFLEELNYATNQLYNFLCTNN